MSAKQLTGNFMGIHIHSTQLHIPSFCLDIALVVGCMGFFFAAVSISNTGVITPDEVHLLPSKLLGIAINSLNMHSEIESFERTEKAKRKSNSKFLHLCISVCIVLQT